jgi:hypothetical protein
LSGSGTGLHKRHFHDFLRRRAQNLMNFGEDFAQLLVAMADVLTTTSTCTHLLPTPITLTTRLSASVRDAGIRSFIIFLNITSAAHPEQ